MKDNNLVDKIVKLDGFDTKTANKFVDNLESFKKFYKKLKKVHNLKGVTKKTKQVSTLFAGKKIVFTGFRDKELEKFIEENGGSVSSSVSANTSLVVYSGDTSSSKYKKAVDLQLIMISKSDFVKKYKK